MGIYDKLKLFEKKNVKTLEMIFPIMHTGDSLLIMVPYGRKKQQTTAILLGTMHSSIFHVILKHDFPFTQVGY